jgi:hypothetical protein
MIKNLSITSPHLTRSDTYSVPYVGNNGQSAGTVRWNILIQQMEVSDGIGWINISQNADIGLDWSATEAIHWVQDKIKEEEEFKTKLEKHPTLKHAYEQYKIIEALVYEEETSGT